MHKDGLKETVRDLLKAGRYTAAASACEQALSSNLSGAARCETLVLRAQALVHQDGRWNGPALLWLKEAFAASKPKSIQRGKVLVAFTAAYAALAAVSKCREARDAFVELRQYNESETLAVLYPHIEYNLALAHHEVEHLEEAQAAYLFALDACNRFTDPATEQLKLKVQHNLVDVFQELGRHEEAHSLMELAYSRLCDDVYGAQMRNRTAAYALHRNDVPSAVLWVESGLGHPGCDVRTRAALLLTKAKILRGQGRLGDAHDFALEAMRLAAAAASSRLCHRVSRFLNHLEEGVST